MQNIFSFTKHLTVWFFVCKMLMSIKSPPRLHVILGYVNTIAKCMIPTLYIDPNGIEYKNIVKYPYPNPSKSVNSSM